MAQQVWMVRAGRDAVFVEDFLTRNMVAIGWGKIGDLREVHGREAISALIEKEFPEYNKYQLSSSAGQVHRFRDELIIGETVVTYDPSKRLYTLGKVDGDYLYRPDLDEELQHTRSVKWTATVSRDALKPTTKSSLGSISTIFCVSDEAAQDILSALETGLISETDTVQEDVLEEEAEVRRNTEQKAFDFLQDRLSKLAWDEMQELVAGLLRAMGYKTRVSASGPDRGRDIIASPDGFGFEAPRIIVEVKHRKGRMGAPEIRSFTGGLRTNDNGLYVSTGGFSKEAQYEADRSLHHLMLMDIEDFTKAIIEHYDRMDIESRSLLPLKKIYWPT